LEKAVSSRETRGGNTFHAGEGSMNEKWVAIGDCFKCVLLPVCLNNRLLFDG